MGSHRTADVAAPITPWPRVVHVITGLGTSGAEMILYKLLSATPDAMHRATVISLTADGPVGVLIRSLGVPVYTLNLDARRPNPAAIIRLAQWIKKARPDIVQTWRYRAGGKGGGTWGWRRAKGGNMPRAAGTACVRVACEVRTRCSLSPRITSTNTSESVSARP